MCHGYLEIDINNFNILTAQNGSGKSAIFHAINWAVNGGTNHYIKRGERNSSVSIIFKGDNYKREVKKDKYFVYKNDLEICTTKDSFANLGINIPLDFFNQFDKLFLLNETPKNRADMLNNMFDIEKIEIAMSNVTKDIKNIKQEFEKVKITIENEENTLSLIDEKLKLLLPLQVKYEDSKKVKDVIESVYKLKGRLTGSREKITLSINNEILKKLNKVIELNNSKVSIDKVKGDIDFKILSLIKELKVKKDKLKSLPSINCTVDNSIVKSISKLVDNVNRISKNNCERENLEVESKELNKKLKGSECPLCKKKI
jgi:DNA repair ATPase RecN